MREIESRKITEAVRSAVEEIAFRYPDDVREKLENAYQKETNERGKGALEILLKNADIAANEHYPICQDTGMAVVFVTIGQDVHVVGGSLKDSINTGVREGYQNGYLRMSVVDDPLFLRKNTTDNTPAIIYYDMVEGETLEIEVAAKGFGSENMSRLKMCKPAEGVQGIKDFVIETVKLAGPNACPPLVIGVGIGGTFDYAARMAKYALLRPLDIRNEKEEYAALEAELLEQINSLNIGPLGLKGDTTALAVNIETYPTHIAGMPCAVNINCHVTRHKKVVL